MPTMLATPVDITPTLKDQYVTVDVSAHVSADANGVFILVRNPTATEYACTLTEDQNIGVPQGGGVEDYGAAWYAVKLTASKTLDIYTGFNLVFHLLGYTTSEEATYVSGMQLLITGYGSATTGDPIYGDGWLDVDISSYVGSDEPVVALLLADNDHYDSFDTGYRVNGSTDDIRNAHFSGDARGAFVGVDASGIFEFYVDELFDNAQSRHNRVELWLVGWLKSNATWNTNAIDISPASSGLNTINLSGNVAAATDGAFFLGVGTAGFASTGERHFLVRHPDDPWGSYDSTYMMVHSALGDSQEVVTWTEDTSMDIYLMGETQSGPPGHSLEAARATASGATDLTRKASGAPAAARGSLTSTGAVTRAGAGAVSAARAALSGSGGAITIHTGDGAIAAAATAIAGSGEREVEASAVFSASRHTLAGTGVAFYAANADGTLAASGVAISVATELIRVGTGSIAATRATLDGLGGGATRLFAARVQVEGVASTGRRAQGALTAARGGTVGEGEAGRDADGALVSARASTAGAGAVLIQQFAYGALVAPRASAAGAAEYFTGHTASGAMQASQGVTDGLLSRTVNISGGVYADPVGVWGYVIKRLYLDLELMSGGSEITGAGYQAYSVFGPMTAGPATAAGAGYVVPLDRFATGDMLAPPSVVSASIMRTVYGSGTISANEVSYDAYPWVEHHAVDGEWVEQKTDWGGDLV